MTYRVAQNDHRGALRTFQSSWILLTFVSLALLLIALPVIWLAPWQQWLNLSSLSGWETKAVLSILGVFSLLTQQNSVFESGFRCEGNFAAGTFWWTIQRLGETSLATIVAMKGGSLVQVALTYLLARVAGTALYARLLFRLSPWLHLGIRHADWSIVKRLTRPAVGFIVFPLAYALSLQGFTLLVGVMLGSTVVMFFTTMRTFTRLNLQLTNTIARPLWPELSSAFASGNVALARTLHRYAFQATIVVSATAGCLTWIFGPAIYNLWIAGKATLDPTCFHVLLLLGVANSVWNTSSVVPMSTNVHDGIAWRFLFLTSLSLALGVFLARTMGMTGAAVSLLMTDLAMCWIVLHAALKQLGVGPKTLLEVAWA
jgi:O-antigen/teichoic acid export membrane protein